ncbi:MAG TPA: glycoside hydrolase family 97 catalytic domain-containing protein [Polyangiaceae bacterium]|nr:glycoside hydrolase family 97 catalytic domain-containing protein [Polyangiaceae bacterium]
MDTATSWTLSSPNRSLRAVIELAARVDSAGSPAGPRLYYSVALGKDERFTTVLEASPLGVARGDADFIDGLSLANAGARTRIDETYSMVTGKRLEPRNLAHQRILTFRNSGGALVELELRAYDDGFAFRYRFPEVDAMVRTMSREITGFHVPAGSRAWLLPYDPPGKYAPAYESYWQHDVAAGTASPTEAGWCMPALFRTPSSHWALILDTNVGASYAAMHLEPRAEDGVYRIAFPEAGEANGLGGVNPSSSLPWVTPWRVVIAGADPGVIVNSTLATDLADPSIIADTSWIVPGRASWSWWSSDASPGDYRAQVDFVNLARDMTWEYTLVDAGWDTMANGGNYLDLTRYAASQQVGTLLWYNSGGPHNSVLDLVPRDRMYDAATRRAELQRISQAGVRGIKVDFFHGDGQAMMRLYADILRDTAEFHLLANFHGSTIQRGWQRTYPNLMSTESVRGAEWYKFDAGYAADAARRNTILVFTRNAVGSMDFTPVTFSDAAHPHVTTFAHELALSIVFESGIQHFADRVAGYTSLPAGARAFLSSVPTTWHDTRYLEGSPGEYVVLARRNGERWYIGGIAGDGNARELQVDLSFLGAGRFLASVIADGKTDRTFSETTLALTRTDTLPIAMRGRGGFVVTLTPIRPE